MPSSHRGRRECVRGHRFLVSVHTQRALPNRTPLGLFFFGPSGAHVAAEGHREPSLGNRNPFVSYSRTPLKITGKKIERAREPGMGQNLTCEREADPPRLLSGWDTNGFQLPKCSRSGHNQSRGVQDGQKKISRICPYTSAAAGRELSKWVVSG